MHCHVFKHTVLIITILVTTVNINVLFNLNGKIAVVKGKLIPYDAIVLYRCNSSWF